jgi:hypothetical protein
VEGDHSLPGGRSPHPQGPGESLEGERASAGRGCFERGTLNANRKANRSGASLFNTHMPPLRLQGSRSGKMDESGDPAR